MSSPEPKGGWEGGLNVCDRAGRNGLSHAEVLGGEVDENIERVIETINDALVHSRSKA